MENIKISDCFDNIDPVELDNIETGKILIMKLRCKE
jgi:hypothetical protein